MIVTDAEFKYVYKHTHTHIRIHTIEQIICMNTRRNFGFDFCGHQFMLLTRNPLAISPEQRNTSEEPYIDKCLINKSCIPVSNRTHTLIK